MNLFVKCPECKHGFTVEVSNHRTDTITHEIRTWVAAQVEAGKYPTRMEAVKALNHLNPATVSTQYQRYLADLDGTTRMRFSAARLGLNPDVVG